MMKRSLILVLSLLMLVLWIPALAESTDWNYDANYAMIPVSRILQNAYRRICAHRIAEALLPLTEESLTFDRLETVLSSGKALEQIQSLIGKGYLQNLRIDSENRTVGLYMPEGALVQWVCASCGAKNLARRGGPMRCIYCDQPRGQ